MRKLMAVFILFIFSVIIYADEVTTDTMNLKSRDNINYFMKFRGTVSFDLAIYQKFTQGDSNNHLGNFSSIYKKMEGGITVNYGFIAPFLTSNNALFSGNNMKLDFGLTVSLAALRGAMSFTFTPIAFYSSTIGFKIGTCWTIGSLIGIGINDKGNMISTPFKAFMQLYFLNTLQFDVAYLVPKALKRWTHLQLLANINLTNNSILGVSETQPYIWISDDGENLNGWLLYATFFIGYKIPIIEDDTGESKTLIKLNNKNSSLTLGMMNIVDGLNLTHFYDSTMANKGWGSDFVYLTFGPVIKIELPYNIYIDLFAHWSNNKRYTSDTFTQIYYQDRVYEDYYLYFKRFGFSIGYKF